MAYSVSERKRKGGMEKGLMEGEGGGRERGRKRNKERKEGGRKEGREILGYIGPSKTNQYNILGSFLTNFP